MSETISSSTGSRYGVERVCTAWEHPRSTLYLHRQEAAKPAEERVPHRRRGPAPKVSDGSLLLHIQADLAASPFIGEGHRKVWARLRLKEVRVSRKRILRLMREHGLLSPHRGRKGEPSTHEGTITTTAPNVMWGTDGTQVMTVDVGRVWIFAAIDHYTAECVGWHVCKEGTRFAALEPIAMGLKDVIGAIGADVARGLKVRHDHGTQYMSDHFQNQIKFWGATPSFAFVGEPETNGVAERFNRTLKEQAIYGRIFKTIDDVKKAIATFVALYNAQWRLEKLGYMTPREARHAWCVSKAA